MEKKSLGRQKIEMKKIENISSLAVTYSKRRSGLFKKASELCTLCGVEICIIVHSPGKKVYSFVHPSVEAILERFNDQHPLPPPFIAEQFQDMHLDKRIKELNRDLTKALELLDVAKKKGDELKKNMVPSEGESWWEKPIKDMDVMQLERMMFSLDELSKKVDIEKQNLLHQSTSNPKSQFHFGSSSTRADPFDGSNPKFSSPPMMSHGDPNNAHGSGVQSSREFVTWSQSTYGYETRVQNDRTFEFQVQETHNFSTAVEVNFGFASNEAQPSHGDQPKRG